MVLAGDKRCQPARAIILARRRSCFHLAGGYGLLPAPRGAGVFPHRRKGSTNDVLRCHCRQVARNRRAMSGCLERLRRMRSARISDAAECRTSSGCESDVFLARCGGARARRGTPRMVATVLATGRGGRIAGFRGEYANARRVDSGRRRRSRGTFGTLPCARPGTTQQHCDSESPPRPWRHGPRAGSLADARSARFRPRRFRSLSGRWRSNLSSPRTRKSER
jgi:hypothetical protein